MRCVLTRREEVDVAIVAVAASTVAAFTVTAGVVAIVAAIFTVAAGVVAIVGVVVTSYNKLY